MAEKKKKKKYVSTSRADRTEDKRRSAANKAENKRNSGKRDAAFAALGAAAGAGSAVAAGKLKSYMNKPPSMGRLYRANQYANLKGMSQARPGLSKNQILKQNSRQARGLAQRGLIQSSTPIKGAKGSGGAMGLRKDDISFTVKPAKKGQGMSQSRYSRLTGGGAAPGRGMGQGGRGGGGFLGRTK
jgi:hypothetical protein